MSYLIPGKKAIKFAFSILVAACTIGSASAGRAEFTDEDFGKIVTNQDINDSQTQIIVLPITEAQN